jgi:hypothetical protein
VKNLINHPSHNSGLLTILRAEFLRGKLDSLSGGLAQRPLLLIPEKEGDDPLSDRIREQPDQPAR